MFPTLASMNEDLYEQVWGEPRPAAEQSEPKIAPLGQGSGNSTPVDIDISVTIRQHLEDLRKSQEEIAKLTDRLTSIEQGLDRALQALVEAASPQPKIVEKVKSLSRKAKPA